MRLTDTDVDSGYSLTKTDDGFVATCQRCGWRTDPSATRVALIRLNGPMHQHERRAHAGGDPRRRPASERQRQYVRFLASTRRTDPDSYARAFDPALTNGDCLDLIPLLKASPPREDSRD